MFDIGGWMARRKKDSQPVTIASPATESSGSGPQLLRATCPKCGASSVVGEIPNFCDTCGRVAHVIASAFGP